MKKNKRARFELKISDGRLVDLTRCQVSIVPVDCSEYAVAGVIEGPGLVSFDTTGLSGKYSLVYIGPDGKRRVLGSGEVRGG